MVLEIPAADGCAFLAQMGMVHGCRRAEPWLEMVDDAPIGGGGGVVELVDHDVVEGSGLEPAQMRVACQGLNRGKQTISAAASFSSLL